MNTGLTARSSRLVVAGAILIAFAAVAAGGTWAAPTPANPGATRTLSDAAPVTTGSGPVITIGWMPVSARETYTADINYVHNEIQDGQFCLFYGLVDGEPFDPPYHFEWSGQFTDSHASQGPLGPKQIVSGNIDLSRGDWVRVDIWEDDTKEDNYIGFKLVEDLDIDEGHEYNGACEG